MLEALFYLEIADAGRTARSPLMTRPELDAYCQKHQLGGDVYYCHPVKIFSVRVLVPWEESAVELPIVGAVLNGSAAPSNHDEASASSLQSETDAIHASESKEAGVFPKKGNSSLRASNPRPLRNLRKRKGKRSSILLEGNGEDRPG